MGEPEAEICLLNNAGYPCAKARDRQRDLYSRIPEAGLLHTVAATVSPCDSIRFDFFQELAFLPHH